MKTTQKGLRDGKLEKDTYGQLTYSECDESLKRKNDFGEVSSVRICTDCGREWKKLR